jgi:transcriptional regulator with XRE-family HTH domain
MLLQEWIIFHRKRNNMTQTDVAKKLHISTSAFHHYESGRSVPDEKVTIQLVDILKANPEEIELQRIRYHIPNEVVDAKFSTDTAEKIKQVLANLLK